MRRVTFIGLAALAMATMAGCSSGDIGEPEGTPKVEDPNPEISSALVFDEHTDIQTVGHLHTADGDLSFRATIIGVNRFSVNITVNGKSFDGSLDGNTTVMDGHDAILTAADRALLQSFSSAFLARLAGTLDLTHDATVYRYAAFLSIAPEGYAHKRIVSVDQPEVAALAAADAGAPVFGDEGKICLKVGTTVNAAYTGKPADAGGAIVYSVEPVLIGSNWGKSTDKNGKATNFDCMGKCGAACGIGGGYTKDCLDHDTCSFRYRAAGGSADSNCGDEYSAASSDIMNTCSTK